MNTEGVARLAAAEAGARVAGHDVSTSTAESTIRSVDGAFAAARLSKTFLVMGYWKAIKPPFHQSIRHSRKLIDTWPK